MIKRTRVDEVQYGSRPGPGGVVGSGGGGGGVGVAVTAGATTVTIGTGTGSGGTISAAMPISHAPNANLTVGVATNAAIAHHRILTPQHGGAQTIAYLPSTSPATGTTIKTVETSTTSASSSAGTTNAGAGSGNATTSIQHISAAAGTASGVSTGGAVSSMQYSTSYVTSIPANNAIKSTGDVNIQIQLTGSGSVSTIANSSATVASGTTVQAVPTSAQNQNNVRTRTINTTNQQQQPLNSVSGISQALITSTQQQPQQQQQQQQQQQTQQTPIVNVSSHLTGGGVPVVANSQVVTPTTTTTTPLTQQTVAPPRLKVEDALSYLDQVKFQYADQPQIYNNFLDIMKEFKSQCIDTPGVIQRVSTLFKGHTELIYGFNMFLPPGYKIEIHSDELGCSVPVVSMPSPTGAFTTSALHTSNMIPATTAASATVALNKSTPSGSGGAVNLMTHSGASLSQTTIHALQSPATPVAAGSNSNTATIAQTGGAQVSVVSGPQQQIVPQGVTMAPVSAHLPQNYSRDRNDGGRPPTQSSPVSTALGLINNDMTTQHTTGGGGAVQHNLHHIQQAHQSILLGETAAGGGVIAGQGNQPVEFNHAITYVNKIKLRFQNQPEKYKKFLEILHTYQKEQKVIKEGAQNQTKTLTEQEVYTQVAKLFGQDEDLLREFGQFLPDATNHHHGNAINAQHAAYTNTKTGTDYNKTGRGNVGGGSSSGGGTTTVIGHSTALSGGAHITMSSNAQQSNTAALHLGAGTTLAQIGASGGPHAAALGNLSSVNTSVSIKPFSNNNTTVGQHTAGNHLMQNVTGGVGGNRSSSNSSELVYEKEHYPHTNVGGTTIHLAHHGASSVGVSMNPPTATTIRASNSYEKDGSSNVSMHRTNNHLSDAHKYQQLSHGHASITTIGSGGMKQKSSPGTTAGYATHGNSAVISVGSVSSNLGPVLGRANMGTSINYVTPQNAPAHHNLTTSQRRPLNTTLDECGGPPPSKRHKPICRDVSFSEASRKCTISDAAFFDKVRKVLKVSDVYDNFLRCLILFNQEIIAKTELLILVTPFLRKFPDLLRWFTDFLGPPVTQVTGSSSHSASSSQHNMEGIPLQAVHRANQAHNIGNASHLVAGDRQGAILSGGSVLNQQSELSTAQEIDLSSCKRLGASYCALPQSTIPKKCSGRTALCREVLNDKWVSFPTWASEDSTFVTSRKTQFEETIYRTEDERFELDVVIETNSATIRVLEGVQKKLSRMPPEELSRYQLDDCLGGTSQTIHQRAIHRIYGDKASEIIQGLKKNPAVAVPIILNRMKFKEEEWREAQKGFNKIWRDQNEKYYLKSLDHQAIFFKPNDMKALRSKSLFNEIETLYDERHEQDDHEMAAGPHLKLPYKDKTILDDAANLLIHHVKRQTSIQKQEKTKIKAILRQFIPDLFFSKRQPLSDDEREEDSDPNKMDVDSSSSRLNKNDMTTSNSSTKAETLEGKNNYITGSDSNATQKFTSDGGAQPAISSTLTVATADSSISEEKSNANVESTAEISIISGTKSSNDNNNNKSSSAADMKLDEMPSTSKAAMAAAAAATLQSQTSVVSSSTPNVTTSAAQSAPSVKIEVKQEVHESTESKPENQIPLHALNSHMEEAYTLFFGNNNWYLFFRLHAILCERLHTMYKRAQIIIAEEEQYKQTRSESTAMALRLKAKSEVQVEDFYTTFIDMLKNVLDGNMDTNSFEDSMREMFGIHAYISFTLDKVVSNAVRQLQNCVTEKGALECVELFHAEQRCNGAGGLCRNASKNYAAEQAYERKAENSLRDENCFKIFIYKIDCRVTIELLDTESEESEKQTMNKAKSWSNYVDGLTNPSVNIPTPPNSSNLNSSASCNASSGLATEIKIENMEDDGTDARTMRKPRFLERNKRKACLRAEQASARIMQNHNRTLPSSSTDLSSGSGANKNFFQTNLNENTEGICKIISSINKRLPERIGSVPGSEKYVISDRDEVKLNASGRQVFVINKNLKFFKLASVRRAKRSHPTVTKHKYANFLQFTKKWLKDHVSDQQQQQCQDWLLGKTLEKQKSFSSSSSNSTKILLQPDISRTPYRAYNRYKLFSTNLNTTANNNKEINLNQTILSDVIRSSSDSNVNPTTESISKNTELTSSICKNEPTATKNIAPVNLATSVGNEGAASSSSNNTSTPTISQPQSTSDRNVES